MRFEECRVVREGLPGRGCVISWWIHPPCAQIITPNLIYCYFANASIIPRSTNDGISAANQGAKPKHNACATPKCGAFLAHSGLK